MNANSKFERIKNQFKLLGQNKKALIEVFNVNRGNHFDDFADVVNSGHEVTLSDCLNESYYNKDGALEVTSEDEIKKLILLCKRTYIIDSKVCTINNLPYVSFFIDDSIFVQKNGSFFVQKNDLIQSFDIFECAKDCWSRFRISFQLQ
ncbi:TPA: hypothetical protein PC505_003914 [Morganella morganii]|nr:hypothetical protein [Morganella morganii]HDF2424459.1 hypothetical protein [Morganella morganii]